MPGDGERTGVEAAGGELGAQRDDPRAHSLRRPSRAGHRSPRPRIEGLEAAVAVALEQTLQVLLAQPVRGRSGRDGQPARR